MKLIDAKVRGRLGRYLVQCGLATLVILGILLSLNVVFQTAIITTLGATTFIVFAMPRSKPAQLRRLLGGYFLCSVIGVLCSLLARYFQGMNLMASDTAMILCGSLAVGIAIFVMTITNTEHPPAAGMALSLVLSPWDVSTILFVFAAVGLLALATRLLRRYLLDLV